MCVLLFIQLLYGHSNIFIIHFDQYYAFFGAVVITMLNMIFWSCGGFS